MSAGYLPGFHQPCFFCRPAQDLTRFCAETLTQGHAGISDAAKKSNHALRQLRMNAVVLQDPAEPAPLPADRQKKMLCTHIAVAQATGLPRRRGDQFPAVRAEFHHGSLPCPQIFTTPGKKYTESNKKGIAFSEIHVRIKEKSAFL